MADQIVENPTCAICGAEIREGALFCYGCGKAIPSPRIKVSSEIEPGEHGLPLAATDIDTTPPTKPDHSSASAASNGRALRTASSLRQKQKKLDRKNIEITWVEPERASPVYFIVSAVLGILALTLILLALYLR